MHLDTHAVIWLYAGQLDIFPASCQRAIEQNDLVISPAVVLEIQYLYEIERIKAEAPLIIETLTSSIGLSVSDLSFRDVINASLTESWTRDPFDRIIVAQARASNERLLTKDKRILSHYSKAFWEL